MPPKHTRLLHVGYIFPNINRNIERVILYNTISSWRLTNQGLFYKELLKDEDLSDEDYERAVLWFLNHCPNKLGIFIVDLGKTIERNFPGIRLGPASQIIRSMVQHQNNITNHERMYGVNQVDLTMRRIRQNEYNKELEDERLDRLAIERQLLREHNMRLERERML